MEWNITGIDFENEESGICRDFFNLKVNDKPMGRIITFTFIILAIVSFLVEPFLIKITQYDVVKYNEKYEEEGDDDEIWRYDFNTVCKDGLHDWKGLFRDKCRICRCKEKTKSVMAYIICPTCNEFYKNTLFKTYTICEICDDTLIEGYEMTVDSIHFTTLERIVFVATEIVFYIFRIGGIAAILVIICAQVNSHQIKKKNLQ